MTRRRFYASTDSFSRDRRSVTLTADEARHLRDVLRLKPGDEVFVFDGEGREFQCAVVEVRKEFTQLQILHDVAPAKPESELRLVLGVALLKGDKFDLVVQKVTELGVSTIVPVVTKLADIRLRDESDASKRVLRWQRIALEAAKQSGRAVVPEVSSPVALDTVIKKNEGTRLFFSESDGSALQEVRNELPAKLESITALTGPEGGWAQAEVSLAREAGWSIVTLGGRTLRSETAAIAITTLLQHLFGDFS